MRVLYAIPHPLPHSENYIRNEIEWMEGQGVSVSLWARNPRFAKGPHEDYDYRTRVGSNVADAVQKWRPDLIHFHPLFLAKEQAQNVKATGLLMTARGHIGFSGREIERADDVKSLVGPGMEQLTRIWVFPHIAKEVPSAKVKPLPSLYAAHRFSPGEPDPQKIIVRAGACLKGKGLKEHLEIARLCPEVPFLLILAVPDEEFRETLKSLATPNVTFRWDVTREEVASAFRTSWACLRSHAFGAGEHRYGMPISIAEAMGAGLPIIARGGKESRQYIGNAGHYYSTPHEAAETIRRIRAFTVDEWRAARDRSLERARLYHPDLHLPAVLDYWKLLVRTHGTG